VVSHSGKGHGNKHLWLCLCDCGKKKVVVPDNLSSDKSNSCGCLKACIQIARKGKRLSNHILIINGIDRIDCESGYTLENTASYEL